MRALNDRIRHNLPLTVAEREAWWQWQGGPPSSSSSEKRRKRKKKRKKKLPKSGRPHRQGRRRPCVLQRQIPAVQGVLPVGASGPVHLQSVGHSCCGAERSTHSATRAEDWRFVRRISWWMLTRPLLRNDRDMVRQCRKPCWCRRCSLSKVVDFPSCRRGKSHGPACSEIHRDSAVAVCLVVDAPVVQVVLATPVVDNDRCARFRPAEIREGAAVTVRSWLWTSLCSCSVKFPAFPGGPRIQSPTRRA